MNVAVLGAGLAGVCTALELADRGVWVDLYDENDAPISRAGRNNEGKVHLGLVYANDRSLRTAQSMILGALHFTSALGRWIDVGSLTTAISDPYEYAVHPQTMVSADELAGYYRACQELFADAVAATGLTYLGRDKTLRVERTDAAPFPCAFRTSECAVDPRRLADLLGAAVHASPRIAFVGGTRVVDATANADDTIEIGFGTSDTRGSARYDHVVNALWGGRLEIDATLGLEPERPWLFRYKTAGWIRGPVARGQIPSMTIALGPFGDIVNYGDGGIYFSWYPTGLLGRSSELRPPDWDRELPAERVAKAVRESFTHLAELCPPLAELAPAPSAIEPIGGTIFAWGETDIDEAESRLHTRYEVGVHTVGSYHSLNPGKYTLVPYLALKVADRLYARERAAIR